MQMIFHVEDTEEYLHKGKDYKFPEPPDICPHPDCKSRVRLKKHGFYYRYYSDGSRYIKIAIRRYICPVCRKTVSFLPDFCLPHFQYSIDLIVRSVKETISRDTTISSFIAKLREFSPETV
ncbi:MAG: DUF6431 domain-containing protein, partial [Thermoanaerobacteraceae bacterium]|nr:DUF6431 domain-containing protein [Thermoanaerobacteraceae bacterium]